jgi:Leucine-rich repeat (LRR) protein
VYIVHPVHQQVQNSCCATLAATPAATYQLVHALIQRHAALLLLLVFTTAQVLDVSNNRISKVEHLQGLTQLQDLWLNDNQIPSLEGLEDALSDQRDSLTTIYLENNPAASAADYKQRMLAMFPGLIQLDADDLDLQHSSSGQPGKQQTAADGV